MQDLPTTAGAKSYGHCPCALLQTTSLRRSGRKGRWREIARVAKKARYRVSVAPGIVMHTQWPFNCQACGRIFRCLGVRRLSQTGDAWHASTLRRPLISPQSKIYLRHTRHPLLSFSLHYSPPCLSDLLLPSSLPLPNSNSFSNSSITFIPSFTLHLANHGSKIGGVCTPAPF